MSEHLSPQQQSRLITHELEGGQLSQALAHLAACAACREHVNRLRGRAMFLANQLEWSPAHLEFEQLAAYLAGRLDEVAREIAENHLAVCEFCAAEVDELARLKQDLSLTVNPAAAPRRSVAWGTRFNLLWQIFHWKRTWTRPALAGAAFLFFISTGLWWWQARDQIRVATETLQSIPTQTALPIPQREDPNTVHPPVSTKEELLALIDHGQKIALQKDGTLSSALNLPAAYEQLLQRTLTNQRLALPAALKTLSPAPGTLKGSIPTAGTFRVLAPIGSVLQTDRPVFRWQSSPGATHYTVSVLDEEFNVVLTSDALTQTHWRASRPLPRGHVYLWQVTAQAGEQTWIAPAAPAPEARFRILTKAQVAELQQAKRDYPHSHFLLATLYAQAGLLDDAARELRALQAENPASPLLKQLLSQIHRAK